MVLKLVDFFCLSLICRNEQSNEKIGIFCNHPMLDFLLSLQNNFRMTLVPLTGPASPKVSEMISERDAVDRSWPPGRSGNRQPSCFERSRQRARSVVPSSLGGLLSSKRSRRSFIMAGRAANTRRYHTLESRHETGGMPMMRVPNCRAPSPAPLACVPNCPTPQEDQAVGKAVFILGVGILHAIFSETDRGTRIILRVNYPIFRVIRLHVFCIVIKTWKHAI